MEEEDENAAQARRWERQKIDSRLKATLRLADGTSNSVFGRGHSLSPGGLGAYIPAAIAVGEKIDVELTFSYSSSEVRLRAIVRSCEGFRYNLEFVEVPEEVKRTLLRNCNA